MRIATHITWLTVTLAISLRGASVSADNWPQWRGPAGTGASSETRLPESWSDTGNIAWKTRLNGVVADRVGRSRLRDVADRNAKTGAQVWRQRLGGIYTASPVAGDGKIYLLSAIVEHAEDSISRVPLDELAGGRPSHASSNLRGWCLLLNHPDIDGPFGRLLRQRHHVSAI
jgi:hypothetical protein